MVLNFSQFITPPILYLGPDRCAYLLYIHTYTMVDGDCRIWYLGPERSYILNFLCCNSMQVVKLGLAPCRAHEKYYAMYHFVQLNCCRMFAYPCRQGYPYMVKTCHASSPAFIFLSAASRYRRQVQVLVRVWALSLYYCIRPLGVFPSIEGEPH